jgi:hypothetical protein
MSLFLFRYISAVRFYGLGMDHVGHERVIKNV